MKLGLKLCFWAELRALWEAMFYSRFASNLLPSKLKGSSSQIFIKGLLLLWLSGNKWD